MSAHPLWQIVVLGYALIFSVFAVVAVIGVGLIRAQERRTMRAAQKPLEKR